MSDLQNLKPRFRIPERVPKDEIITIKTLIAHPMESGVRKKSNGDYIPAQFMNQFEVKANGETVYKADLGPGLTEPLYLEFNLKITEKTALDLHWQNQAGDKWHETATIDIETE